MGFHATKWWDFFIRLKAGTIYQAQITQLLN